MHKDLLRQINWEILPSIGLLCFVFVFVGMIFWIYRKGSTQIHNEIKYKALDDGELK